MDNRPVFLVVGDFTGERIDLVGLCAEFGWRLQRVPGLESLSLEAGLPCAAGLIDTSTDGGAQLRQARRLFPQILWIACSRFSSTMPWAELERCGAFHFLHRPLRAAEFLHALGFVDAVAAQHKRMEAALNASHAA
jgi:hypothetical protein